MLIVRVVVRRDVRRGLLFFIVRVVVWRDIRRGLLFFIVNNSSVWSQVGTRRDVGEDIG
jgi:hypothetical protein